MPDLRFDASLISNRVAYTPSSNQQILLNHLAAPPTRMALALNSARAPHRYALTQQVGIYGLGRESDLFTDVL